MSSSSAAVAAAARSCRDPPSDREAWAPAIDLLAREREVVAVDLPGFATAHRFWTAPTVHALAAQATICNSVGASPVGKSMSGFDRCIRNLVPPRRKSPVEGRGDPPGLLLPRVRRADLAIETSES